MDPVVAAKVGSVFVAGCVMHVTQYVVTPAGRVQDIVILKAELWSERKDEALETPPDWDFDTTDAPDEYVCPITSDLMHDPYVFPDGSSSYEKNAIFQWLATNAVSPVTREPMSCEQGCPNRALKRLIEQFVARKRAERG